MVQPRLSRVKSPAKLQQIKDMGASVLPPTEGWQKDAYNFNEVIGEVGYVNHLTANSVGRCAMTLQRKDDETGDYASTKDDRVRRVWDAFTGPRGGKAELLRRGALNYVIAGECYLVGENIADDGGDPSGISWEFLSIEEIKIEAPGQKGRPPVVKRRSLGASGGGVGAATNDELEIDAYVARWWKADPRFSERADSAMKRVLPICRELVLLTQVVDAIAKSRLSAGVLYVPDEMSFGPIDETDDGGQESDDIDRFIEELVDHLRTPVEDRTSAAGLVPLVVNGPAEFSEKFRLVDVARQLDELYSRLRAEAIIRLGTGMDIPPEIVAGKGGLNHWTGYNIDADFISRHVNPIGEALADFLTSSYLHPMLVAMEEMTEDEANKYRLVFDDGMITSQPDAGPAARSAWDRGVISDEAYVRANGLSPADFPDEDEKRRRLIESLVRAAPVTMGPRLLPTLHPEFEGVLPIPGDPSKDPLIQDAPTIVGKEGTKGRENQPVPSPGDRQDGDPSSGAEPDPGNGEQAALVDRVATWADAALDRALDRAGAKVVTKVKGKDPAVTARIAQLPKTEVLSHVSDDEMRRFGLDSSDLFIGAFDQLERKTKAWVRDFLVRAGVETYIADEAGAAVASDLTTRLTAYAMSHQRRPIRIQSNGLRVPYVMVEEALEASTSVGLPWR